jgi:hypothetical protein
MRLRVWLENAKHRCLVSKNPNFKIRTGGFGIFCQKKPSCLAFGGKFQTCSYGLRTPQNQNPGIPFKSRIFAEEQKNNRTHASI